MFSLLKFYFLPDIEVIIQQIQNIGHELLNEAKRKYAIYKITFVSGGGGV